VRIPLANVRLRADAVERGLDCELELH
jgi:hypothetical protein